MPIRATLLCLLLTLAVGAQAKMYRWTDENGQTVYSQTPPPDGKAQEIKPPPPPSQPAPAPSLGSSGSSAGENTAKENSGAGAGKQPAAAETPEVAEDPEIKARNCQAARHNLEVYEGLGSRLVKREDGSIYRPDAEERQKKIDESREQVEKYCTE